MREARGTSGAFLPHKSGVNEELRYTQKPDVNVGLRGGGGREAQGAPRRAGGGRGLERSSPLFHTRRRRKHTENARRTQRETEQPSKPISRAGSNFFFVKPAAVSPLQIAGTKIRTMILSRLRRPGAGRAAARRRRKFMRQLHIE